MIKNKEIFKYFENKEKILKYIESINKNEYYFCERGYYTDENFIFDDDLVIEQIIEKRLYKVTINENYFLCEKFPIFNDQCFDYFEIFNKIKNKILSKDYYYYEISLCKKNYNFMKKIKNLILVPNEFTRCLVLEKNYSNNQNFLDLFLNVDKKYKIKFDLYSFFENNRGLLILKNNFIDLIENEDKKQVFSNCIIIKNDHIDNFLNLSTKEIIKNIIKEIIVSSLKDDIKDTFIKKLYKIGNFLSLIILLKNNKEICDVFGYKENKKIYLDLIINFNNFLPIYLFLSVFKNYINQNDIKKILIENNIEFSVLKSTDKIYINLINIIFSIINDNIIRDDFININENYFLLKNKKIYIEIPKNKNYFYLIKDDGNIPLLDKISNYFKYKLLKNIFF